MKYFQTSLPNPEQTGIGERATTYFSQQAAETNWWKEEEGLQSFQTRIELRYAAENLNGNSSALKKIYQIA